MDPDLEDAIAAIIEAEEAIDNDPLAFTVFNPAQLRGFRAVTVEGVKIVICPMPNGIGKTFMLAALMGAIQWPTWNPAFAHPLFREWPYKRDLRFVSNAELVKDTGAFQQAIKDLWPRGRYAFGRGVGKPYYSQWETDSGFIGDVLTFDQSQQQHAGPTKGAVFISEPGPKRIVSENLARLRAGGFLFWEMTPLNYASYAKDEYIDKGGLFDEQGAQVAKIEVVTGDIEENCREHAPGGQLPHNEIAATVASWPIEEREARKTGGFMHLAGRVYTKYSRENGNIIPVLPDYHQECFDKGKWTLYQTIDPHDRKPWAVGWHAVFPNEDVVTIAELPSDLLFHETPNSPAEWDVEYYREATLATEKALGVNAHLRYGDPNFCNAPKLGPSSIAVLLAGPCRRCSSEGDPVKRALLPIQCDHRIALSNPPNSIPEGHLAVRTAIGNVQEGKRAKYLTLEHCANHVYGLTHYGYKDERNTDDRGPSETPLLVNKDFPDGVRYGYLAKWRYVPQDASVSIGGVKLKKRGRGWHVS